MSAPSFYPIPCFEARLAELRAAAEPLRPSPIAHGTPNSYRRHHCRCAACVSAFRAEGKRHRAAKAEHGTRGRYVNGCRCPDCAGANAAYIKDRRRRVRDGVAAARGAFPSGIGTGHGSIARAELGCDCPRCERALEAREAAKHPHGPPRWRCACDPWRVNPGESVVCAGCGSPAPWAAVGGKAVAG